MKVTRTVIGTGITRRERTVMHPETAEDDLQAAFDSFALQDTGRDPFLGNLDGYAAAAAAELRKRGLPSEEGAYYKVAGGWKKHEGRTPAPGVAYHQLSSVMREEGFAHDTVPSYAAEILRLVQWLKTAVATGAATPAAIRWAFELGALLQESRFKFRYEKAIMTGAPVLAGARRGGRSKNASTAQRDIAMAHAYLKQRPLRRLSDTALKAEIGKAQEKPLGRSASINAIARGLQILSSQTGKPDD